VRKKRRGVNEKWRNEEGTGRLHCREQTGHAAPMPDGFDIDRIGGSTSLRRLTDVIVKAGDIARKHFERGVVPRKKPDRSPVTAADREVEEMIRAHIAEHHPEAGFLGEETGSHRDDADIRFIVDPIDGTRAFVRGLPTWSVLVGIEADGEPSVGLAYMPASEDLFVGVRGQGATHNDERVRVSETGSLADATVMHGSLQQFTGSGQASALTRLASACDSARGFPDFDGYRQVLLGRADAMVDPGVKPYDVCAAAVLVREAGGRFTSMSGQETIHAGSGLASNGAIHDELVAALRAPSGG